MIEIKQQSLDKIHALLTGVQDADKKVLKPALARGLMAGKAQASRGVRETYHISPSDFNRYGFLRIQNVGAAGGGLLGSLEYSGGVIPLIRFKTTPNKPKGKATPAAAVLKANAPVPFNQRNDTFIAQMKSGHIGVFSRQSGKYSSKRGGGQNKHTEALKELQSPAVPKQVGNEKVMKTIEDRVSEVIEKRIDHEIERILNKYGG